jgi:hypothetical protein
MLNSLLQVDLPITTDQLGNLIDSLRNLSYSPSMKYTCEDIKNLALLSKSA